MLCLFLVLLQVWQHSYVDADGYLNKALFQRKLSVPSNLTLPSSFCFLTGDEVSQPGLSSMKATPGSLLLCHNSAQVVHAPTFLLHPHQHFLLLLLLYSCHHLLLLTQPPHSLHLAKSP